MDHPDLRNCHHETKSNGPRFVGGVMALVEDEVSGPEAQCEEVGDVFRR